MGVKTKTLARSEIVQRETVSLFIFLLLRLKRTKRHEFLMQTETVPGVYGETTPLSNDLANGSLIMRTSRLRVAQWESLARGLILEYNFASNSQIK